MWTLLSVPREESLLSARLRSDAAAMGLGKRYYPRDGLVHVAWWQYCFQTVESHFRPRVATCFFEKLLSAGVAIFRRATVSCINFSEHGNLLETFLFATVLLL